MFNLNETSIGIPLDTINLITLTYYSSKSEILNIYDTNFDFNEDIVPLTTSVLETKPSIIQGKRYSNVNSESFIIINSNTNTNTNINTNSSLHNKSDLEYPCFFYDIQNNHKLQNIQGYSRKLINTLDTQDDLLVRMYKLEEHKGEFGNCILNEEELMIIIWNWEYANFQIIINKANPRQCQLQLNVYITEDNKIISNKLEQINGILKKIQLLSRI